MERVRDYPRPPRLEPTDREIVVRHGGVEVARSRRARRVLETFHPPVYYLPPDDVRTDLLTPDGGRRTVCEWKGGATYWNLTGGPARVAWSYENPVDGFRSIAGYFAFYAGRVDEALVDGVRAEPQPGSFYGGWITPDLEGPFKGGPGTEGW